MTTGVQAATFTVEIGVDVASAFDFFSRVENLNRVTPDWFRLDPLTRPPERLAVGVQIDYRFRWRLFRMPWRTRITEWQPPHRFTYEQERGPYRFFRHEHRFEGRGGRALVTDVVRYRTLGGWPVARFLVRPELSRIFAHRSAVARRLFPVTPATHRASEPRAIEEPA
jgi:ligand-binding SRPBCC domain-containing protein